jgi:hypothetical protein
MMTYGSSNYLRIVFMFKQNSKSDGDDQRKSQGQTKLYASPS